MVRIAVRTITLNVYKGKCPHGLASRLISDLAASAHSRVCAYSSPIVTREHIDDEPWQLLS